MADGTRMKQMEAQLQQVTPTVADMQIRMGSMESVEERRIDGAMEQWREESRE